MSTIIVVGLGSMGVRYSNILKEQYPKEIEHFLSAIEKDQKVSITGEEDLKTIEVIEAIHQAHDSGRKVSLQT